MNQPAEPSVTDRPSASWSQRLWEPCDVASVAFFRVAFAGIMLWHVYFYCRYDLIERFFVASPHHLSYFGFEWVKPLDGSGMRMVYYLMGLAAVGLGLGLFYRFCCVLFFLTFTYTFLAEAALYQNHYYLISLLAFLLILIPAHRSFSLDAVIFPARASKFVPNWCRWLLMFQIAVPHVYGGFAKLNSDWLHAMPVGMWVANEGHLPIIGPYLTERWAHWVISYAGLLLDLSLVPLLLWRRTRLLAYFAAVVFHLLNSVLFSIDVFPWFMILATLIFFPAHWPRRFLRRLKPPVPAYQGTARRSLSLTQRVGAGVVAMFVLWQMVFPFRHVLYPGNPGWTEEGRLFAWRMMLCRKDTFIRFYATDGVTKKTYEVPIARLFNLRQLIEIAISPDQIVAITPFLAERARTGLREVEIRAVAITSLNGRKPQLMIDPNFDLTTVDRRLGHQPWIVPLTEPLRTEPWDVPSNAWPEVLGIELPAVQPQPALQGSRAASSGSSPPSPSQ